MPWRGSGVDAGSSARISSNAREGVLYSCLDLALSCVPESEAQVHSDKSGWGFVGSLRAVHFIGMCSR